LTGPETAAQTFVAALVAKMIGFDWGPHCESRTVLEQLMRKTQAKQQSMLSESDFLTSFFS
jgi:hypothetical protein